MFTSSCPVTDSKRALLKLVLQEGEPGLSLLAGRPLSCRAWQVHPRAVTGAQRGRRGHGRAQQGLPGVSGKHEHGEWYSLLIMTGEGAAARGPAFPVWQGKDVCISSGTSRRVEGSRPQAIPLGWGPSARLGGGI